MTEAAGRLALLAWLSPSFPVGSFAYSHGLEWAQEAGWIAGADSLQAWLCDLVKHGSWHSDAVLASVAHRAAAIGGVQALAEATEFAAALCPSAERRLETLQQGSAFVLAVCAAWPCAPIDVLRTQADEIAYPIALGVAAAGHRIEIADLLEAYGLAFVSNLTSAAIRLNIIGQTDGQRIIAALAPVIVETAATLRQATLDDLGSAALRSDLASCQHETQYSRLFRS